MTQEEKDLLLKDLAARLPYGVKVMKQSKSQVRTLKSIDVKNYRVYFVENDVNSPFGFNIECPLKFNQQIKPFLRPMSSMTEEERNYYNYCTDANHIDEYNATDLIDFFLQNHLDFRGLIPMRLALEAPEGMYSKQ